MNVIHAALQVSDLDATRAFYEDALGLDATWEFTGDDGVRNYYVAGLNGTEIQFKYDPDDPAAVDPSGFDHLAFGVESLDAEFERIVDETGCDVLVEPTDVEAAGARVAFVEDPDGYAVELVQPFSDEE